MSTTYPGEELELFAHATHWKAYWAEQIRPCIGRDVLEVGAGIGTNTYLLRGARDGHWVCVEPDPVLAAQISISGPAGDTASPVEVVRGTLSDLEPDRRFDTVLYIDVLEHILDDGGELVRAAAKLRSGGHIIVLAPAHPWLFSPFDRAVGHHRRYTWASLSAITPPKARSECFRYLDSAGILASLANRVLLRSTVPAQGQIHFWDRWLVPVSRLVDPCLGYRVGKSVLAIWRVV